MSPAARTAMADAAFPPIPAQPVKLVAVTIAGQCIGIPIGQVRDVFMAPAITGVPLAPAHVAGLVNLRGRIVTVLSLRAMMGYPAWPEARTVIGLEWQDEAYGLLVDGVSGVIDAQPGNPEPNPPHLDIRWSALSAGIHRLQDGLLMQLDTAKLFQTSPGPALS